MLKLTKIEEYSRKQNKYNKSMNRYLFQSIRRDFMKFFYSVIKSTREQCSTDDVSSKVMSYPILDQ